MKKKFGSLLIAFCMILTMIPHTAFASIESSNIQVDLSLGDVVVRDCDSYKQVEQNDTVTKTTGNVIIKQTDSANTKTENVIKLIGNTSDFKVSILDLNVDAVDRPAIAIEGKVIYIQ